VLEALSFVLSTGQGVVVVVSSHRGENYIGDYLIYRRLRFRHDPPWSPSVRPSAACFALLNLLVTLSAELGRADSRTRFRVRK